MEEPQPH